MSDQETSIKHYGMPRRSGRYPWGSGENPYQRNRHFLGTVDELKKEGMTEAEIARSFDMTTTQLRALRSIARNENRQADISQAQRLKDRGWSNVAIGERMGIPESTVRNLLKPGAQDKVDVLVATANMIEGEVKKKGYVDVGTGVENYIGVSRTKLNTAIAALEEKGYRVHKVKVPQLGTGHETEIKLLATPETEWAEIQRNRDKIQQIQQIQAFSEDGGRTYLGIKPPKSVDSKRVRVVYDEEGGSEADGVIYVRPGVDDISLGASRYAQVRIAVDGTHYLKGMAVYKSDMPSGVDLEFNTNKRRSEVANDKEAMKPMKTTVDGSIDPDNPFGAVIARQHGVMNILKEEGAWSQYTKSLSTQVLSKQSPKLAKQQLDMTFERKQAELKEIKGLTNPVVKKRLLEGFADGADSSAVHLKAAALPGQSSHVLLPGKTMKPTEVYAPNYKNGTRVSLIRHPHGGIFEIPELTVNNRNREARSLVGNSRDAVVINSKVAERLSGADFDGDDVIVIPNDRGRIKSAPALEGLKNFDPVRSYPAYEGMPKIKPITMQQQMGDVSNLITDMTIRGASSSELARAVRHSMVVIDSEKKNLNVKQSALDNGIASLKEKYQSQEGSGRGASTLVSRARSTVRVPERKLRPASKGGPIDRETGKLVYVETGRTYVDDKGREIPKVTKTKRLALTDDAFTLSSGTPIENLYASHSNRLKTLANEARKEMISTKNTPYSPSARAAYSKEVASLDHKLNIALMNAPRERQAQIVGNTIVKKKRQANPDMTAEEVKKVKSQALAEARSRTGAAKDRIEITPSEWEAIQAGAISTSKLEAILRNTDLDAVKQLATPKTTATMTSAKEARARSMAASGYTQSEIAEALGVSTSTISDVIQEGG